MKAKRGGIIHIVKMRKDNIKNTLCGILCLVATIGTGCSMPDSMDYEDLGPRKPAADLSLYEKEASEIADAPENQGRAHAEALGISYPADLYGGQK